MKDKVNVFLYSQKAALLLWIFATIYAGYAVCYLLNAAGFARQVDGLGFTQSAMSVLPFVVVGYFLYKMHQEYCDLQVVKNRKRRLIFALGFGSALALSFIWGYELRIGGNTLPGYINKLCDVLLACGCGLAILPLTEKCFALLDRKNAHKKAEDLSGKAKKRMFWFSFLGIVLCWIPVFLAYYPAIMSYDFNRQSGEAYRGFIWFNDHHPLVHTYLIRCFLLLGEAIGSYEIGMAIFSGLQMLIVAAVLAYSCNVIGRLTGRIWPVAVAAVLYGLLPVHPVLAMSMTKDILFTAFFLLLVLLIWEREQFAEKCPATGKKGMFQKIGFAAAILITGILAMLFRNNAVYAFAVFTVFYVILSRKERVLTMILCVAIIAGGIGGKTAIREAMDAGSGSSVEMFSVFMQQFARVGRNQRERLTEEEWNIIDQYVPEYLWKDYNPPLADTIKGDIAAYYFTGKWEPDITKMLTDWVKIGIRYPNEYIDAFLELTAGYWFLDDVSHAEVLSYGNDTNWGLLYTFNVSASDHFEGVESKSFLPGLLEMYQKIVNGNSYYRWPILSLLFKPAFYCWGLWLAMVSYWYQKEHKKQLYALFPFIYLLTLLLGPVVNMRYVYPIMVVVPVLAAAIFTPTKEKTDMEQKLEV